VTIHGSHDTQVWCGGHALNPLGSKDKQDG
jgi:hypothetical protein